MRDAAPHYYNEFDPAAAAWLRELITAGLIPRGDVDERSIEDVKPGDLRGYRQHHFFAGIGGWAYALALAGWPADRPVWTGSCPCQPFSAAGKGAGFEDQRHLWPAWFHLIRECRPPAVFGEQVASKAADPWIDLVHADMEGVGYAFGCVPFPAAGIGAPHIRDRNYWVAYADGARGAAGLPAQAGRQERLTGIVDPGYGKHVGAAERSTPGRLADSNVLRLEPEACTGLHYAERHAESCSGVVGMEHASSVGRERWETTAPGYDDGRSTPERAKSEHGVGIPSTHRIHQHAAGPLHGFWGAADWLGCRDGKFRPVEPGAFPLAHGLPARVGRLRGYGNAVVPQAAAEFVIAAELARADMLGCALRAAA